MPCRQVHFYTISGQRFTARTALYKKLELLLPEQFPGRTFAFLGNPFDSLPFPLLWDTEERNLHATTRVLDQWGLLNEASQRVKSALDKGAVVFTDGLGLDVMLYAAALVDCPVQNDEAFRMHSGIVTLRLHEQGIPAPVYFITRAKVETVDAYMLSKNPELARLDARVRHDFIAYEERMCEEYFKKVRFQNTPHYIDASLSIDEMAGQVVDTLGERLGRQQGAAA